MHDDTLLITTEEAMERLGQVTQDMIKYHDDNKIQIATHDEIDEIWNELKRFELPVFFTLQIDESINNPETAVQYVNETAGHGTGWDTWKNEPIFKDIKPCVLKNGKVQYYLNPNDYTKKIDGSIANLDGIDGDVMVEFPRVGYKFSNINDKIQLEITNSDNEEGFCYLAHSLNNEGDCEKIYIGAYLSSGIGTALHSYSNATPRVNITLTTSRTYHEANGTGYQQLSFYPWTLMQVLYLFVFKNRNSQEALGMGYVTGNSDVTTTGQTNSVGMCGNSGDATDGKHQVKCLGIEDFWGNAYQWCDGIFTTSAYTIWTDYNNFTSTVSLDVYRYSQSASYTYGYMKNVQGTNNSGFLIKTGSGSATTFWTDNSVLYSLCFCYVGGYYSSTTSAGAFCSYLNYSANTTISQLASRLVYKQLESKN